MEARVAEYALIVGSMLNSLTATVKDLTGDNQGVLVWFAFGFVVLVLYGLIFSKR
jgi:hypothetical protein